MAVHRFRWVSVVKVSPSFDNNVLSVGRQLYVLLDAVGYKDDRIDDENGIVLIGRIDIGFYKYI